MHIFTALFQPDPSLIYLPSGQLNI